MQFARLFLTVLVLLQFAPCILAETVTTYEHGAAIYAVEFHPTDSSQFASGSGDHTVKLWNLRDGILKTFSGHTDKVNAVAFSPDGATLVSGSDDNTFKLWNIPEQQHVATLEHIPSDGGGASIVTSVAFSPDGNTLVTAGYQSVKFWNVSDWTETATLQHDNWVWTVAFSRDGRYLATDDGEGTTVKVWDIQRKQIAATLEGHTSDINFVKFSPDRRTLASTSWGGEIKLWSVSNWEPLGTLHAKVAAIDFSPDGKVLVSAGLGEVVLWSVDIGEKIVRLPGHTGWIRGVAFSSDGTSLASGGEGGKVRAQNIKPHLEAQHQRNIVRLIYFLPSDRSSLPGIDKKHSSVLLDKWITMGSVEKPFDLKLIQLAGQSYIM